MNPQASTTAADATFAATPAKPARRRRPLFFDWQAFKPALGEFNQSMAKTKRKGGGIGKMFGVVAAIVAGLFCLIAGPIGWLAAIFVVPLAYMIGRAIPLLLVGFAVLFAYHALFGLPQPAKPAPAPAPAAVSAPAPAPTTTHALPKLRAPLSR